MLAQDRLGLRRGPREARGHCLPSTCGLAPVGVALQDQGWGQAYRLQEAVQLQRLAQQPPPPLQVGRELVTQVAELMALGADGVHGVVLVADEPLALLGQCAGPLHGSLRTAEAAQLLWAEGGPCSRAGGAG